MPTGRTPGPWVIVSEPMARRFWTDSDAVGRLVRRRDDGPPWLVVGVASDAKVRQLGESPRNMIYLPYSQRFTPSLTVVARTSIDPERTALALLTAGRELDPDLRVLETKTMDRHLALMRLPQQLSAFVLSAFGVLALALAAVGLYGVSATASPRRAREQFPNGVFRALEQARMAALRGSTGGTTTAVATDARRPSNRIPPARHATAKLE